MTQSFDQSPGPNEAPASDPSAVANSLWSHIDKRAGNIVQTHTRSTYGVPRARGMSMNFPIAGLAGPPLVGWLQSVIIFQPCRVTGWQINALVGGILTVDIQVNTLPVDPTIAPVPTSLPGTQNYPALNGFTIASYDTSKWLQRDVEAGSTLHVFVIAASTVAQAVLGLQLLDLRGRLLEI